MMNLAIHPVGCLPERWAEALEILKEDLSMTVSPEGIPVTGVKGSHLAVACDGAAVTITWAEPVQFYRALSLVPVPLAPAAVEEQPCFQKAGVMFDASRNGVPKPEALQFFLRKMALMGLNLGMMYTEDTYEVPERPYFGYKRGRYFQAELRALDDYADALGIELCPCIQTLGHLNRALHWPEMQHLRENRDVILPDDPETYEFLEQLIRAATAPYRSNRIHIGMDEAFGVGLGAHYYRYGYEAPHSVMRRHLERVLEITNRLGLDAVMWSDMYFALDGHDYHTPGDPSQAAIDAVAPGVTLMYWDYYHNQVEDYRQALRKHSCFPAKTVFAGGLWTWCGPAPDYYLAFDNTVPALTACKEAGVPLVLATAWGDCGAETNLTAALLGMQLYGEFTYRGGYDEASLRSRFDRCCGADAQAFLDLAEFNRTPQMPSHPNDPGNLVKLVLYQDPLVPLFEADMEGLPLEAHFAELEQRYTAYAANNLQYRWLFTFYAALARVVKKKGRYHQAAGAAVRQGDRARAGELADLARDVAEDVEALRLLWRQVWERTNKPQGFEVIDLRLGGVRARMLTAGEKLDGFASGELEDIPELREQTLPYKGRPDGSIGCTNTMEEIVTACVLDHG